MCAWPFARTIVASPVMVPVRFGARPQRARERTDGGGQVENLLLEGVVGSHGFLPIRVPDPERYLEFGQRAAAEGATRVRAVLAEYEAAFAEATSALREEPDEAPIESLLQRIRRAYLNEES